MVYFVIYFLSTVNTNIFYVGVADNAKIRTIPISPNTKNDAPWFDAACVRLKNEIRTVGRDRKRMPKCELTRDKLSVLKKDFKKTIKRNKRKYKNDIIEEMNWNRKDAKTFWKTLDKLERKDGHSSSKIEISPNKWIGHFKNLLNNPNDSSGLPGNTKDIGPLDHDITDGEIKLGAYILRAGKSSGYDRISNEMISCLLEEKPELLKKLFNDILHNPL